MGRTAIDEDPANGFGGVYVGEISDPEVKEVVEKSDLVIMVRLSSPQLHAPQHLIVSTEREALITMYGRSSSSRQIGSLKSDFNTGEFSYPFSQEQVIELHSDSTLVQYAHYPDVSFHMLLPALAKALKPKPNVSQPPEHVGLSTKVPDGNKDEMVTQKAFWPMMGAKLFKEGDVVVTETGTSNFGILGSALPKGSTAVSQVLWGSIGFSTPCTLGALLAAEESSTPRRTILFTGDGSIQLTIQEVATMVRLGLKPILVILNNNGCTSLLSLPPSSSWSFVVGTFSN